MSDRTFRGRRSRRLRQRPVRLPAYRPLHRALRLEALEERALLSASISSHVWLDTNGNGTQDAGEPGMAGVVVDAYNASTNALAGTAVTDSNGNYSVAGLPDSTGYYLVFHTPPGYTFTTQGVGSNPAVNSAPNAVGLTPTFTLTTGQNDTNLNAGLRGGAQPFGWAFRIGSASSSYQTGTTVVTDSSGNVYVAVFAEANYDPGPGTVTSGGYDCLAKYSPAGALIWLDSFNAQFVEVDDGIHGLAIAPDGSVYAVGQFSYPTAFNPASSSLTNPAENAYPSAFVLKLSSSGSFDWVHTFGTASEEVGAGSVAVDSSGNVYTAGYFQGKVNFNPGGTYNLNSGSSNTFATFILKLTSSGSFGYAGALTPSASTGIVSASGIAVGSDDSVYVAGSFEGTANFNPGGTHDLTSMGGSTTNEIFVLKLSPSGGFTWVDGMGGTNSADDDEAASVALSSSGNVYIAGGFVNTCNFNPGGTYDLSAIGPGIFVEELTASGGFVWVDGMSGDNVGSAEAYSLALGPDGSVYTTGSFYSTVNFNPGSGTDDLSAVNGGYSVFISKLSSSGSFDWAVAPAATGVSMGNGIAVGPDGSVYTTGYFLDTYNFSPGLGTDDLTAAGSQGDAFVYKINGAALATTTAVSSATGTYGNGSLALTAQVAGPASSGTTIGEGSVTFTVTSGSTTIATISNVSVSGGVATGAWSLSDVGAGSYSVTAAYSDTSAFPYFSGSSTTTAATATVNEAVLTVTAGNASRTYGATDPTYTATYSGFVNGDTLATAVTGSPSFNSSDTAASPAGTYVITPGLGSLAAQNYSFTFAAGTLTVYATVAGRDIFYANSSYNGNSDTASSADDNAIDTSKSALLPGQTATFANYAANEHGINGIMVDVAGLANPAALTAADFQFLVGNDSTPSDWTSPAVAPTVTVRVGAGTGGSDRVELIWPDNTIRNEWLQVTVLADANSGLASNDVFYFGSEPGAVMGNGYVSFDDIFAVYRTILAQLPTVTASTAADVNHDGMINFDDIFAVYRAILANNDFTLNMITAPTTPAAAPTIMTVADAAVSPAAAPAVEAAPVAAVVTAVAVALPAASPAVDPAISATVATTAPTVSATDVATPAAAPAPPAAVPLNLCDLPATTVASLPTVRPAAQSAYPSEAPNPPLHVSAAVPPAAASTVSPTVPPAAPAAPYSGRPAAAVWTDRRVPEFWTWDAALAQTSNWNSDLDELS